MNHPKSAYALFNNGEAIAITNTLGININNQAYIPINQEQIQKALFWKVPVIKGSMLEKDLLKMI